MTYGGQGGHGGPAAAHGGPGHSRNNERMLLLFGVVVILGLLVGIIVVITDDGDGSGGGSEDGLGLTGADETTSTTPESTTTTVPTSEGGLTLPSSDLTVGQLETALLTPQDLSQVTSIPWSRQDEQTADDAPSILDDPDISAECREAYNLFRERYDAGEGARATFVDDSGDTTFLVTHSLYLVRESDPSITDWMADYETCTSATYTDPEYGNIEMRVLAEEATTQYGEESVGFDFVYGVSRPHFYLHDWVGTAYADRGVVSIVNMAESADPYTGEPGTTATIEVDRGQFQSIMEKADERLAAVLE